MGGIGESVIESVDGIGESVIESVDGIGESVIVCGRYGRVNDSLWTVWESQ